MIYLPFLYYYLGPFSPIIFITYFLFIFKKIKLKKHNIIIIVLLLVHFIRILFVNDFPESLNVIRYYWGFLFFYLFFISIDFKFSKRILFFFVLATLLETILINTIVSASILPNFPNPEDAWSHFASEGSYQRPYAFGGNATILSVLLVSFLFLVKFSKFQKIFVILSIILSASGTGIIALAVYFINLFKWYFNILFIFLFSIFIYSGIFVKISFDYIQGIYLYKIFQITNEFSPSALIWGTNSKDALRQLGGDFSFLSFLEYNGLIGLLIFVLIVVFSTVNRTKKPLFILILCSLHYGVIFSMPGQLIFAYFLSINNSKDINLVK